VVLLADVILVVLYFLLISQAENPDSAGNMARPNALDEALVLTIIFCGYVVWDALTKLGRLPCHRFLTRTWITWVCTLLCLVTYTYIACARSIAGVVVADVVLLGIVITFRAFKDEQSGICVPRVGLACLMVTVVVVIFFAVFYSM